MRLLTCLKGPVWEHPFNTAKICIKVILSCLFIILRWMCWKLSLLVRSGILRPFVNTLSVDDQYSRHYRENFARPIRKQLWKKQNFFSIFFFLFFFWNLCKILNILKKGRPHCLSISNILHDKRCGYLNI